MLQEISGPPVVPNASKTAAPSISAEKDHLTWWGIIQTASQQIDCISHTLATCSHTTDTKLFKGLQGMDEAGGKNLNLISNLVSSSWGHKYSAAFYDHEKLGGEKEKWKDVISSNSW